MDQTAAPHELSLSRYLAVRVAHFWRSSGPTSARVARLFGACLAVCFLIAWASLSVQLDALLGANGLLPWDSYVTALRERHVGFSDVPSYLLWCKSARAPWWGVAVGVASAVGALLRIWPRAMFAVTTAAYLSFVVVGRTFLSFQWDNLLLECGLLATFLPQDRPARGVHILFRLLLFKLYFESGLAKWQSGLGDWQDGSAMSFYYETAPLPTWLAFYAHHLPAVWHRWESWLALVLELIVPWFVFLGRRGRALACLLLTGFQVINMATANYGFFCLLALALHVFLLEESFAQRLESRLWSWRAARRSTQQLPKARRFLRVRTPLTHVDTGAALWIGFLFVYISLTDFGVHFAEQPDDTRAFNGFFAPFRLINTYHLFGSITRQRIEPELQTSDGTTWTSQHLRHKPGPVERAPDFVEPHQPRLDFQLWFHGLSTGQLPGYLAMLLVRLCNEPAAVQRFFAAPLPPHPRSVRLIYWRYSFASWEEHSRSGAWWGRKLVGTRPALNCANLPSATMP